MKRLFLLLTLATLTIGQVSAQDDFYAPGKRVGVGVGFGLEGVGIDASVSLTKWCSVRLGLNIMPDISYSDDFDVELNDAGLSIPGYNPSADQIHAKASLKRTTVEIKADFYPFPNKSSFFLCGGFSFGGRKLVKVTGQNDNVGATVRALKQFGIENEAGIRVGDYLIPADEDGYVEASAKVSGFRPYLGFGFGRLIPKKRVAVRFELGASFQGKPKLYVGDNELDEYLGDDEDAKDDISDILDLLKVYPVLKLSIRGRIL